MAPAGPLVARPPAPPDTEPPAPRPIVGLPTRAPAPPLSTQALPTKVLPTPGGYDANFAVPVRLGLPDGVAPAAVLSVGDPVSAPAASWAPPSPSMRKRLAANWVRFLVGALVVAVVLGGWRVVEARLHAPPPEVKAFIHGGGEAYMPLGQGFTARLPARPTDSVQTVTVNGTVVTMHLALIQEQDWEAGIVTIDLPAPLPPGQVERAMRSAFASGNSAVSGRLEKQDPVSHEGWPAMDAEIIPPDGHPLLTRIVVVKQRVYVLLAHSVNGTNRFFDELVDSFHAVG